MHASIRTLSLLLGQTTIFSDRKRIYTVQSTVQTIFHTRPQSYHVQITTGQTTIWNRRWMGLSNRSRRGTAKLRLATNDGCSAVSSRSCAEVSLKKSFSRSYSYSQTRESRNSGFTLSIQKLYLSSRSNVAGHFLEIGCSH